MGKTVQTAYGLIEGIDREGYSVFKGIPYAKSPVGELRWKAPVECDPWDGVYRADHFGNIAMQDLPTGKYTWDALYYKEFYSDPDYIPPMSEDCLYLNIWAPEGGKDLPVAFWIHGGGFGSGFNSEIEFDGEAYCKKDVILVTVEYRLNVFGFLAHPWLSAENERGISGNYGILDQIAALRWVYENIAAFGGDPKNITVYGQSAGGMSTQVLVSSYLTDGMISKAILQSAVACEADILATPSLSRLEGFCSRFPKIAGVSSLKELRALTSEQLMDCKHEFEKQMMEEGAGLILVPNVDGYVLEKDVKTLWKEGSIKDIPYMTGAVTNDLGSTPEEIKNKEPGIMLTESKAWSFGCEKNFGHPAYVYYFSHDLPGDDAGAFHSAELWYTFGTYKRSWRPMGDTDAKLSEEMVSCWTNFMKSGKPDGENWQPCTQENPKVREF